ncbi:MAG: hypothetical protein EXS27_11135 [Pedosphaera sp.]|nr:hypothetical protein [Pedosphaera sp.]
MKNSYSLLKALLVAGIVGTMAHVSPLAHAAPAPLLTTTQKGNLTARTDAAALINEAKLIINAAPAGDRQRLAEEITAWVAVNKPALRELFTSTLIAAYPALNASGINAASLPVAVGVAVGAAASQRNAKEASPN